MRRKLSLIIFTLILSFILFDKAFAASQYSCTYEKNVYDRYEVIYTSTDKSINIQNCIYYNFGKSNNCTDYQFNTGGHLLSKEGACPSSIDVNKNSKLITWVTNNKGKYVKKQKVSLSEDDGTYTYMCIYEEAYKIELQYKSTADGSTKMTKCTAYAGSSSYDCSDYDFDTEGHLLETETSCPSSIDVNKKKSIITWVTNNEGDFKKTTKSSVDTVSDSCTDLKSEGACDGADGIACLWVEDEDAAGGNGGYCNVDNLQYVYCGDARDIPTFLPYAISFLVNLLKIATPIILIFMGIITLVKAMAASKEDEIKKAQSSLVKKIIAAAMVFFVIYIVQFVILKVASTDEEAEGFSSCLSCFLNNDCANNTYYKTNISGIDYCTDLTSGNMEQCPEEQK